MKVFEFFNIIDKCNDKYHFILVTVCKHVDKLGIIPASYSAKSERLRSFDKCDIPIRYKLIKKPRHMVFVNRPLDTPLELCKDQVLVDPNITVRDIKNSIKAIRKLYDGCDDRTLRGIMFEKMINKPYLKFFRVYHNSRVVVLCNTSDPIDVFYQNESWSYIT